MPFVLGLVKIERKLMYEEDDDAPDYRDMIERARKANAPAVVFAGIYNAQLDYHLNEAVNKAVHDARANGVLTKIDYQNPKYRNDPAYAVTAEDMKGYYPRDMILLSKEEIDRIHLKVDDIATVKGQNYIVKGADNIAEYRTRQHMHTAENNALFTDPNVVPFEHLKSHRQENITSRNYANISAYAALSGFATGQNGDLFAAMKTIRENGALALNALPEGRERVEAGRQLEATLSKQEKLLLPLVGKLMTQRRDGLDAILESHSFAPEVEKELRKAAEAAHQAVSHIKMYAKDVAVQHGLA